MVRSSLVAALALLALARSAAGARTVVDDLGRPVTVREAPLRIVSLAPGATEMLFAAGAGREVVATVEYSDEPPAARQVPRIGDVAAIDMERLVALAAGPGGAVGGRRQSGPAREDRGAAYSHL